MSTLIGIVLKEGYIKSIDQKLIDYFPEYVNEELGADVNPDFSHSDYEKAFRSGIVAVPTTTYARRERPHDANRVYPEPVRLSRPRHQEGSRRI
jgi:hypothetical protein